MLIIRNDQMSVLQAYMAKSFEDRMVQHVQAFFPEAFASLGQETVSETIRFGIERARSYDITVEYDVSRYINLMFTFGREYDLDPELPWAEEILIDAQMSGLSKMDRLYAEAENHTEYASGIGTISEDA